MATLSIRKVGDRIYQALQLRASKHGISMEEEVRQILYQAVYTSPDISQVFNKYFGTNGIALPIETPQTPHDPLEL